MERIAQLRYKTKVLSYKNLGVKMEILTYPDSVLRAHAEPIDEIDDDLQALIDQMIKTMYEAPGIGLATPRTSS